ncbi:hypothetical protein [Shinella sp.]|uniref:hypothetical protein n=1 Tax=Shinella sp. TaxID=1870904 RepID=UPI0040353478
MIIEFRGTESELSNADLDKLSHAITELLIAHRKGHHFGIIPRETSSWLLANIALNPRDHATLARLAGEFTTTAGLLKAAEKFVSIQVGHRGGATIVANAVVVGLDDVQGTYFFDQAAFVVEDQEADGKLYVALARACRSKIGAPQVSLDVRHGGGERSKHVLLKLAEEQRICVLVSDSDCKLPKQGVPAKILSYRRAVSDVGWLLAWVDFIPCREIENLIPLEVVEALPCGVDRANHIASLKKLASQEESDGIPVDERFWWFYDLKKGVDLVQLEKVTPDHIREWTIGKMALSPCTYVGVSETLVSQLLDHKTQLPAFLGLVKKPDWWRYFGRVISMLMWIGFAPAMQRT